SLPRQVLVPVLVALLFGALARGFGGLAGRHRATPIAGFLAFRHSRRSNPPVDGLVREVKQRELGQQNAGSRRNTGCYAALRPSAVRVPSSPASCFVSFSVILVAALFARQAHMMGTRFAATAAGTI